MEKEQKLNINYFKKLKKLMSYIVIAMIIINILSFVLARKFKSGQSFYLQTQIFSDITFSILIYVLCVLVYLTLFSKINISKLEKYKGKSSKESLLKWELIVCFAVPLVFVLSPYIMNFIR